MKNLLIRSLMCALITASTREASATVFHVSPFGSNTIPYDTYENATTNIRVAVALAAGNSDTVLIHAGDYDLDTAISLPRGLTLMGTSRDSCSLIWVGQYSPQVRYLTFARDDVEVSGLAFKHPRGSGFQTVVGVGVFASEGSVSIHDCLFIQSHISGSVAREFNIYSNSFEVGRVGISVSSSNDVRIHDNCFYALSFGNPEYCVIAIGTLCSVYDNTFNLSAANGRGRAIFGDQGSFSLTVRNNLFIGGIQAIDWLFRPGSISNNTFIDIGRGERADSPLSPCLSVNIEGTDTMLILNNVFSNCAVMPSFASCNSCSPGSVVNFDHNSFWPAVQSFFTQGNLAQLRVTSEANRNAFPMFTSDSLYRLQAGSPLIDEGDTDVLDPDGSISDIGWTGGPGGIAYDYPDLSPVPPDSLKVTGEETVVTVRWASNHEADLQGYRLYRGYAPGFLPSGASLLAQFDTADTSTLLQLTRDHDSIYFVVTAVDRALHESSPSSEVAWGIGSSGTSSGPYGILMVYPNPIHEQATVELSVPGEESETRNIKLALHDVIGRTITTCYDGILSGGLHQLEIDLNDAALGRDLASGVYFLRMQMGDETVGEMAKIAVLK